MKKTVFIIGNGFNNIIADIVKNTPAANLPNNVAYTQESTVENILQITKLWEKFDRDFDQLVKDTNQSNHEELIETVYAVINFFSSLERFRDTIGVEKIKEIKGLFDNFLVEKIIAIARDFREHENLSEYKSLKSYFPALPGFISNLFESDKNRFVNIYTTNYDGVLDTIISKPFDRKEQKSGFQGVDGFTRFNTFSNVLLDFVNEHMDLKQLLVLHLHGSYKFTKYGGVTCKIKGLHENNQPVMVFNQKRIKGQIVRADNVLSAYFERLRSDVKDANRLVILGNSMKTENHIKDMLKANLGPEVQVVACSRTPSNVTKEIKSFVNREVTEISTEGITTERELIDLLGALIV